MKEHVDDAEAYIVNHIVRGTRFINISKNQSISIMNQTLS